MYYVLYVMYLMFSVNNPMCFPINGIVSDYFLCVVFVGRERKLSGQRTLGQAQRTQKSKK